MLYRHLLVPNGVRRNGFSFTPQLYTPITDSKMIRWMTKLTQPILKTTSTCIPTKHTKASNYIDLIGDDVSLTHNNIMAKARIFH